MRILIDNDEQGNFLDKLNSLQKITKVRRRGNKWMSSRKHIEYVLFAGEETEYNKLLNFFDVLENRYQIALYYLEKIRKDCEITNSDCSTAEELKDKLENSSPVNAEFINGCEYFIFALGSCLDTMAHIINKMYKFRINENRVSISKLSWKKTPYINPKRDVFSRYLLKEWKRWIKEFKGIRNAMAHQQIIKFSSGLGGHAGVKNLTFTKRRISIVNNDGEEIKKSLPIYFDDIKKNYEALKYELYKKLNSLRVL